MISDLFSVSRCMASLFCVTNFRVWSETSSCWLCRNPHTQSCTWLNEWAHATLRNTPRNQGFWQACYVVSDKHVESMCIQILELWLSFGHLFLSSMWTPKHHRHVKAERVIWKQWALFCCYNSNLLFSETTFHMILNLWLPLSLNSIITLSCKRCTHGSTDLCYACVGPFHMKLQSDSTPGHHC